jgi:hypothetical protein
LCQIKPVFPFQISNIIL